MNENFSFTLLGSTNATFTVSKRPRCKCGAVTRLRHVRGHEYGWPVYRCERCDASERLAASWASARALPRRFAAWLRTRQMPTVSPCIGTPPGMCDAIVPNGEPYCDDCRLARKRPERKVRHGDQVEQPPRRILNRNGSQRPKPQP